MITSRRRAVVHGSTRSGRGTLAQWRGAGAGILASHDAKGRGRGAAGVDRGERERVAHKRLDGHALSGGEIREQPVLGGGEAHDDSSHIRIQHIAQRMQSALRGQAHSGRTHGLGHKRLPCF